jgi:glycosyltransferase involved in cell wall biosynthesis
MRVGFVMPAFNEEKLLERTVRRVTGDIDQLVIVNDGSKDATGVIADRLARELPGRVRAVHHEVNRGVGMAVLSGIRALLADDGVDAIGIIASDDQCDPTLINVFRRILERSPEIGVAKGSRFLHRESLHHMPRFRYWGNRVVSAAMQMILGYWGMSDVLHGYLLARKEIFAAMRLERISAGYDLENTMMAEFRRLRVAFALVPSPSRYGEEKSSIVYRSQIPKTLAKMGALLREQLYAEALPDRIVPALVAAAIPTAGATLPAALLFARLTSPEVRIVMPDDVPPVAEEAPIRGVAAATPSRR